MAIALGIIGAAHFYKAATRGFLRYLESSAATPWITHVSQVGLIARGILFLLFAYFATRAAWHVDPAQTKDLAHVMRWLQTLPGAKAWTALVAIGLGAFSIYSFLQGWYRVVPALASSTSARGRRQ